MTAAQCHDAPFGMAGSFCFGLEHAGGGTTASIVVVSAAATATTTLTTSVTTKANAIQTNQPDPFHTRYPASPLAFSFTGSDDDGPRWANVSSPNAFAQGGECEALSRMTSLDAICLPTQDSDDAVLLQRQFETQRRNVLAGNRWWWSLSHNPPKMDEDGDFGASSWLDDSYTGETTETRHSSLMPMLFSPSSYYMMSPLFPAECNDHPYHQ